MGVSSRNKFMGGLAVAAVLALAGAASANGGNGSSPCAAAGCGGGNTGATTGGQGPVFPGAPTGPGCCNMPGGANVILPGVNVAGPHVSVTSPNVAVHQGSVTVGGPNIITNGHVAGQSSTTTFLSGGGAYFAPQGIAPTTLQNLNVAGAEERYVETVSEQVPVREEICVPQTQHIMSVRPVQAVCLDDTGTPHPASQVSGEREVRESYTGEIYRCMAGTSMQVTIGRINGNQADFSQAQTFACDRGEALVRSATGELSCAPQTPQRDCNERSLLRQHGPGLKLIPARATVEQCIPQTRTRYETRQRQVERVRAPEPAGPIVLDGGVGNSVY